MANNKSRKNNTHVTAKAPTHNTKTETKTDTKTKTRKIEPAKPQTSSETKSEGQKQASQSSSSSNKKMPMLTASKTKKGLGALIIIGSTILVGIIATLLGGRMREGYIKPPAYPPDWVFPVVWSIFYIAIGIAAFIAYFSVNDNKKQMGDMIAFGVHMFFNLLWPLFYFRLNLLIFSTIWLAFMIITAIVVTYRFIKANLGAGIVWIIYTLWLMYAMYLSLGITILNLT